MGGRSISPIANEFLEIVLKSLGLSEVVKICIKCASTDHLVENCSKYWTDRQSKVRHRCINCIIRKEIGINHPASAAYCPLRRDWIHHVVIGKRKSVQPQTLHSYLEVKKGFARETKGHSYRLLTSNKKFIPSNKLRESFTILELHVVLCHLKPEYCRIFQILTLKIVGVISFYCKKKEDKYYWFSYFVYIISSSNKFIQFRALSIRIRFRLGRVVCHSRFVFKNDRKQHSTHTHTD